MNMTNMPAENKENDCSNTLAYARGGALKPLYVVPQQQQQMSTSGERQRVQNEKHAHIDPSFAVTYVDFEQLPQLANGVDLTPLLEATQADFASGEWLRAFHALTALRALNKGCAGQANAIFAAFGAQILAVVESPRPALAKNLLAFVCEVLAQARESALEVSVITSLLEILLRKIVSGAPSLQALARRCMDTLLANCLCDEVLLKLSTHSVSNLPALARTAFHYLAEAVATLREGLSQLQPATLEELFYALAHTVLAVSAGGRACAREMCRYFRHLMGDNYQAYVLMLHGKGKLSLYHVHALAQAVQDKPRPSLAAELRGSQRPSGARAQMSVTINGDTWL